MTHNAEERSKQKNDTESTLIYGRNPVLEALRSGASLNTVYLSASGAVPSKIRALAAERGLVVKQVTDQKLTQMTGTTAHQGAAVSSACAEYLSLDALLEISEQKGTKPFLVLCENVEDPHNLGAIIRTAEAAGADGIIIPKRRSASLTQTVYKTSAGAASFLPVARVSNLAAAVQTLKEHGIWIYGTDAEGSSYTETDLRGAICLVIGSEGAGMSRLMRENCDFLLSLPMAGRVTSLNASVAAGIFMYEAVRQRTANL